MAECCLRPPVQILAKLADPGSPVTRLPLAHTERRVLAEPYKDNKKQGWGSTSSTPPLLQFIDYSIDFSAQAPFVSEKSACFLVLSLLPGLCAMS